MRPALEDLIARLSIVEQVRSSDESIRWHACREAEKLNDLSLLPELVGYLSGPCDDRQRRAVYFIIGCIGQHHGSAECAEALIRAISSECDSYSLACLLDSVRKTLCDRTVDVAPVVGLFRHRHWHVRHSAIYAVDNVLTPAVEDELLAVLKESSDPNDWIHCHEVLWRGGTEKALPLLVAMVKRDDYKRHKRDVRNTARDAMEAIIARSGGNGTAAAASVPPR